MVTQQRNISVNSQVFYNTLGTIIRSGVVFLTMPIFTRLLGPKLYGKYSVYSSWMAIIICFIGLNVSAGLSKGYYTFRRNYYQFRSSILLLGLISCCIFTGCFAFLYPIVNKITNYTFAIYILLFVEAAAQFILNFASMTWTYEKNAKLNMLVSILTLIATTGLSLILLQNNVKFINKFYARVLGVAIPQICIAILIVCAFLREGRTLYNKKYWLYSLSFGLPLIFHLISQQILGQSDRVMMEMINTDSSQIGIYSFVYTFTGILSTILSALNNAWCPFYFDDLNNASYHKLEKKIKNYVEIFLVLCCGFLLVAREVVKVFADEEYYSGIELIPILVVVVYVTFTYQFAVNYEIYNEKPKIIATGTIIAAGINIALNSLLIRKYGMYGAAIATLLSYIILAILHFFVVFSWKDKKYPVSIRYNIVGLVILIANCGLFYLIKNFKIIRWTSACLLGIIAIKQIVKRKTIF